jgi:DNA-directed RNA polymerase specialized sigma24 family protein
LEVERALSLFELGDERQASQALDCLRSVSERVVKSHVRRFSLNHDDAEAIVNEVFLKVWRFRSGFTNRGLDSWHGLLRKTATRCSLDHLSERRSTATLDDACEIASSERPILDALITASQSAQLQEYADECLLGMSVTLSEGERTQRVLAAQLFYLDGLDWQTTLRIAGATRIGSKQPDRAALDGWLEDPGVIRNLAYHELYYSNDRLASHLLGLPKATTPGVLNDMERKAPITQPESEAECGWTWAEVSVILWRYRHGLLAHQIATRLDCRLSPEQSEAVYVKCSSLFPFKQIMTRLLSLPSFEPESQNRRYLASPGLWKRLILQYAYIDDLAYRDMLERTEPPAKEAGYAITESGTLKSWVAMGRLLGELAKYCLKRNGGNHDD